jgi:hypothetical protein
MMFMNLPQFGLRLYLGNYSFLLFAGGGYKGNIVLPGLPCLLNSITPPLSTVEGIFKRYINDELSIQFLPPGQPATLGGLNSTCPSGAFKLQHYVGVLVSNIKLPVKAHNKFNRGLYQVADVGICIKPISSKNYVLQQRPYLIIAVVKNIRHSANDACASLGTSLTRYLYIFCSTKRPRCLFFSEQRINDILARKIARFTQEGFGPGIMLKGAGQQSCHPC